MCPRCKKEPSLSITGASTHTRSATTWTMARLASSLVLRRDNWHLLGSVWQIVDGERRTRRSHGALPRGSLAAETPVPAEMFVAKCSFARKFFV